MKKPDLSSFMRSIAPRICLLICFLAAGGPEIHAQEELASQLQIFNGTDQTVEVFWMNTLSERISNGSIRPGRDSIIRTTIGHRFEIQSENREVLETVTSQVRIQAYRVGGLPKFYTQKSDARGYPIVASAKVSPYALREAAHIIDGMLGQRPDLREAMIKSGSRLCILAWNEFTTDQPEWQRLGRGQALGFPEISAKDFFDARARGMGGSQTDPLCSCGEENLLCYPGDPYPTENILIHELAHNIHLRGMTNLDPTFDDRVKASYDQAIASGLWKSKYASVNHHEYFAEGVQSWFDNNREDDHDHNHVNTRAELIDYDPRLAALCREVFGDTEFRYTKPQTRLIGHLDGYDPRIAPTFGWPERLSKAHAEILRQARSR